MARQAVIVSDLHCGCRYGLCPREVMLDGGGVYTASDLQQRVWHYWESFWAEWVPVVTRGEDYVAVLNGDLIDGRHHGGPVTAISQNIADQVTIALGCLRPVLAEASAIYVVRGTEAHAGEAGMYEELLAQQLGAVPDRYGQHTRYELRLQLGEHALVDCMHHISTAGSTAYESTALTREYAAACEEAGRWRHEAPDVVVRSHRHRHAEVRVPTAHGYGIVCTTPGWQLKTPYVWRISARQQTPQFGGILVRCGDEEVYTRSRVWSIERAPVEIPDVGTIVPLAEGDEAIVSLAEVDEK